MRLLPLGRQFLPLRILAILKLIASQPRELVESSDEEPGKDLKASGANQAFSSSSYLALQDTDYTVGLLRFVSRALQGDGSVTVPLLDGSALEGRLCPEMRARPRYLAKRLT